MDLETEYFEDTDTLSFTSKDNVYMHGDAPYYESYDVTPGLLVDYGNANEIIRLDLEGARSKLRNMPRSFDVRQKNEKTVRICLDEKSFLRSCEIVKTEDHRITVLHDADKFWTAICLQRD